MAYVKLEKPRAHTSLITLDRPERMNAMSFELVGPLHDALREVAADNDTWVVVLTGTGKGFCAGLDLEDHGAPPGIDGLPASRIAIRAMHYFADLIPSMRRIPQPIIAAINGPAVGGGLCLAAGADIRIAAESALFRSGGINNGLTGTELGVSYLLPRLIGASRASELILSGRDVDAREAERMGLVSRVVPDEELVERGWRSRSVATAPTACR
jgi:enoyl-CoA hydratase